MENVWKSLHESDMKICYAKLLVCSDFVAKKIILFGYIHYGRSIQITDLQKNAQFHVFHTLFFSFKTQQKK